MGVNLADLFPGRPITLELLSGRRVAIDAYNALHQFLAIIRQPDGQPLRDSQGRVTSVYSGLFYRTLRILAEGIKPIYVFDGPPPRFKKQVIRKRKEARKEAKSRWKEALKEGDMEKARKYAQSALRLTPEMVRNCRNILSALGLPYVDAPTEGEAQAATMAARGDVWGASSQDFDSLLFGSPRLVRNLTMTGRRKLPNRNEYVNIELQLIELQEILTELGINQDQLIMLGILVGTDYNQGGIRGIGPKRGLNMVREYDSPSDLLDKLDWDFDVDFKDIMEFFSRPRSRDQYEVEFQHPDRKKLEDILCGEFDFSPDRVEKALEGTSSAPKGRQTDLRNWS